MASAVLPYRKTGVRAMDKHGARCSEPDTALLIACLPKPGWEFFEAAPADICGGFRTAESLDKSGRSRYDLNHQPDECRSSAARAEVRASGGAGTAIPAGLSVPAAVRDRAPSGRLHSPAQAASTKSWGGGPGIFDFMRKRGILIYDTKDQNSD